MPLGIVYALGSAFLFAFANIYIRVGQRSRSGDTGAFFTMFTNTVILVPMSVVLWLRGDLPPITMAGLAVFVVAGILTTFLGRYTSLAAVRRIGPSRAVAIKVSSPAVSAVFAFLLLGERLNLGEIAGLVITLVGVYMVAREVARQSAESMMAGSAQSEAAAAVALSMPPTGDVEDHDHDVIEEEEQSNHPGNESGKVNVGVLLGIASSTSFGLGYTFRKWGLQFISAPVLGAAIGSIVACTSVYLIEAFQGKGRQLLVNNLTRIYPPYLIAGLAMTGGQLTNFASVSMIPVGIATVVFSVEPVFTVLLSKIILKGEERINAFTLLSIGVTVLGIVVLLLFRG